MSPQEEYIQKIENIPTTCFNKEQKQIAITILQNTKKEDLNNVYKLITQRVKTGFVFDIAPEVNHNAISIIKENKNLNIEGVLGKEHTLIIGENYDALKNLLVAGGGKYRCNLYRPSI